MNLAFARPIVSISVVQSSLWPQEVIVDRRVLFLFYTANDVDQYSWRDNWDCFVEQDRTQVDQDNDVGVDAVLPHFPNCSVVVAIPVVDDFGFVVGAVHQTNDDGRCDEVKVLPAQRHWRCKANAHEFPMGSQRIRLFHYVSRTRRGVRMPSSTHGIDLPATNEQQIRTHTLFSRRCGLMCLWLCGRYRNSWNHCSMPVVALSQCFVLCVLFRLRMRSNGVANSFRRVVLLGSVRLVVVQCILCVCVCVFGRLPVYKLHTR
jgi:hypothetical protein